MGSIRVGQPASVASERGGPLLEAVRRALRLGQPTAMLVVHLPPPGVPATRPHHRRIARAMLEEAALRHGGQVFAPGCGDLVLLCRQGAQPLADLPALLLRLLGAEAADPESLLDRWELPAARAAALDYAQAHAGEAVVTEAAAPGRPSQTSRIDALAAAADSDRVTDLLQRQTGIVLAMRGDGLGQVRPLFREVSFSIAALEGRAGPGASARADPYLFQHLAGELDRRMLDVLAGALGRAGPLDPCRAGAPRLHLNLTLGTVQSTAFAALLARIEEHDGACPGVEVPLLEAIAEPVSLARAAEYLETRGSGIVVDTVPATALTLADLSALPLAIVKLDWGPHLPHLSSREAGRLDAAIGRLGVSRLVLHRADSEAAIRWALQRGIRRFQGHHVDSMLAAARVADCRHAARCTLRQCSERHAAAGPAGRNFCLNHALLDAGAPDRPAPDCPAPDRPDPARAVPRLSAAA